MQCGLELIAKQTFLESPRNFARLGRYILLVHSCKNYISLGGCVQVPDKVLKYLTAITPEKLFYTLLRR